jgi:ribosomal protein S17
MSKDQLKEERMRVLELLAKGVITSDEAEKLLSAMDRSQEKFVEQMVIPTKKLPFRMLRMYIDSKDGDVVKIQIPIEFAKLLKTQKFNVNLKENDIDIDAILEMVNQGFVGEIVNIESADGDIVKIVVE